MRVLILNQFYKPDLAATAYLCGSLAEGLAESGAVVSVVTSRGGYVAESGEVERAADENPRVHRLWTPRLGKKNLLFRMTDYASFYFAALLRMIFLPRQDVVITLTTPPLIGLAALAHKCLHPSTKIVLWNMDCYPDVVETSDIINRGGFISTVWQWFTRLLFKFLTHVVTLDSAMTELLEARYSPKKKKLPYTVIPNWEPLEMFPTPSYDPPPVSDEDPFTVLYLGNAGFGHRFETVLDAAERLGDDPLRFVFIGGGHLRKEIGDGAEERGLKNVELRGYVPKEETPAVMAAAGAALITLTDDSKGIMSPSKLHSNLAMGLPIIYVGPEGSNVDEAIRDYDCGVSVRHGDAQGMVDYLKRLRQDDDFHRQTRENARRAFEQSYCDQVTLPQFDDVLRIVTGGAWSPEPTAETAAEPVPT